MAGAGLFPPRHRGAAPRARPARGGEPDDEQQRQVFRAGGVGCPAGEIIGGTAVFARQHAEQGGEHAQAQRQQLGPGGAVMRRGRLVGSEQIQQGEVGAEKVREGTAGLHRLGDQRRHLPGDEGPGDFFGPAEDGEHGEADGQGAGDGALGEEREDQQRRHDALQRPPVLKNTRHLRASVCRGDSTAGYWEGDKIAAKIVEGVDFVERGGEFRARIHTTRQSSGERLGRTGRDFRVRCGWRAMT